MTNAIQEGLQRRLNMPDDEAGSRWKVRGTARVASVAGVMGREFRGPSFTGARRGGARCDCLRLHAVIASDCAQRRRMMTCDCLRLHAVIASDCHRCWLAADLCDLVHTLFTRCSQ